MRRRRVVEVDSSVGIGTCVCSATPVESFLMLAGLPIRIPDVNIVLPLNHRVTLLAVYQICETNVSQTMSKRQSTRLAR